MALRCGCVWDVLSLFCDVAAEEDFGGEVVGVTAEIGAAGVGAFGRTLQVAFGGEEEGEVEHFGFEETP